MLTDDMREFLRSQPGTALMWDLMQDFQKRFNLNDWEVQKAISEWIRETV